MILVPISNGELVDKITILDIKLRKLSNTKYVEEEYKLLYPLLSQINITTDSEEYQSLLQINEKIWGLEEEIRGNFYEACDFYTCARGIYEANDRRAQIKKQINLKTGSQIVEQKSYDWFNKDD